jgi:hypothetical protein
MKKTVTILVVLMVAVIGVLCYYTLPNIKSQLGKYRNLKEQTEVESSMTDNPNGTTAKRKEIQRIVKQFESTMLVNVDIGKTDIERTMIIKYNNTVSVGVDMVTTCLEHGIDVTNIDFNSPPDVVSVEQKIRWMEAVNDAEWYYNANCQNIRRELAQKLKLE